MVKSAFQSLYSYILYYQSNIPYNLTPSSACYPFKNIYFICNGDVGTASQRSQYHVRHSDTIITSHNITSNGSLIEVRKAVRSGIDTIKYHT